MVVAPLPGGCSDLSQPLATIQSSCRCILAVVWRSLREALANQSPDNRQWFCDLSMHIHIHRSVRILRSPKRRIISHNSGSSRISCETGNQRLGEGICPSTNHCPI